MVFVGIEYKINDWINDWISSVRYGSMTGHIDPEKKYYLPVYRRPSVIPKLLQLAQSQRCQRLSFRVDFRYISATSVV
jgi:hypothetical protein